MIGNALDRRRFLGLAGAGAGALVVTACGGSETESTPTGESTRTFEHAFGESTIPTAPERVVTTTDQNALLPLLEVGYTPVGSAGWIDSSTGDEIFRRTEGFDTSEVEFVGPFGEVNLEAVAALRPDLIVGYEFDDAVATKLEKIAPFVGVQVFGRRLAEALAAFADLVGKSSESQALQAEYDARIAALRSTLSEQYPKLTVSILSPDAGDIFYLGDEGQAVGTVAYDLELGRPRSQAKADRLGATFSDAVSLERVEDHDADVVFVLDYSEEDGEYLGPTQRFIDSPLVQSLQAAQRGQLHVLDATLSVGAAWARMGAFLDQLEEHLLIDGLQSTGVNG